MRDGKPPSLDRNELLAFAAWLSEHFEGSVSAAVDAYIAERVRGDENRGI